MVVTHYMRDEICVLLLKGKYALAGVPIVEKYVAPLLDDRKIGGMVLNFSKVSLMDSSGIGTLVSIRKTLQLRQADMAMCGLNEEVEDTLNVVGLYRHFPIFETEDEAFNSLVH